MANKKISQLVGMGTTMDSTDLFVVAEDIGGGNYATVKCEPNKVSEYVLNPVSATQISGVNKSIYFDNNDNWDTASNVVTQNPYLQVRVSDGKLVTGSGIANAVGGDDMGDCIATTDLNLQNNPIINANEIFFGGAGGTTTRIQYDTDPSYQYLTVQAQRNLTLSGDNYVILKGQGIALDYAGQNTPFVGEVRVTGGDLVIDPDNRLIVNEVIGLRNGPSDDAALSINGASRSVPTPFNSATNIDWADSNVQYHTASTHGAVNVDFLNVADGQTLTLSWHNTNSSNALDITFRSGSFTSNKVRFGGDDGPGVNVAAPKVWPSTINVFTFVRIGDRIFGSAITGYEYGAG